MKFPKIECPICGTTNVEFFTADDDEEPKKIQFFPNESISTKNNVISNPHFLFDVYICKKCKEPLGAIRQF